MTKELEIIFDEPLLVGESPVWDNENKLLYFVDIRGKCYYRTDIKSGKFEKFDVPQAIGCLALCNDGGLLLCMEDGIYRKTPEGELVLAHKPIKIKGERFNDGKTGPDGCYYVGTAGENFSGAFYRLCDGVLTELFDGCGCSNGIDWTADGKTMYYCDSREQKLEKFDFDAENHTLSNRQTIMEIDEFFGSGDGLCVDSEDNIHLAIWGGYCVLHIDAKTGKVISKTETPAKQTSSCCFAGDNLTDLIITSAAIRTDLSQQPLAGRTFRIKSDVPGTVMRKVTRW